MSRMLQGIERHLQLWQEVRRLTGAAARNVVARNQSERCIVHLASVFVSKVLLGCFPVVLSVSPHFNARVAALVWCCTQLFLLLTSCVRGSLAACVAYGRAWPVTLSGLIVTFASMSPGGRCMPPWSPAAKPKNLAAVGGILCMYSINARANLA